MEQTINPVQSRKGENTEEQNERKLGSNGEKNKAE